MNPGDSVSLTCFNFSGAPSENTWFGIKHRQSNPGQRLTFPELVGNCSLFSNNKFEMSSNLTTVSLKINQVNSSDAGFYFCGYQHNKSLVMMSLTYLRVQGKIVLKSFCSFKPPFDFLHWVIELLHSCFLISNLFSYNQYF